MLRMRRRALRHDPEPGGADRAAVSRLCEQAAGDAAIFELRGRCIAQVTELELQLERKQLHKRLDAIVAAKSVLAGRHVAIAIPDYRGGEIAARLFGADLPCASLTIGGVTVANGVVTTHERYAREIERIARELRDRRADQRSNA